MSDSYGYSIAPCADPNCPDRYLYTGITHYHTVAAITVGNPDFSNRPVRGSQEIRYPVYAGPNYIRDSCPVDHPGVTCSGKPVPDPEDHRGPDRQRDDPAAVPDENAVTPAACPDCDRYDRSFERSSLLAYTDPDGHAHRHSFRRG